MKPLVVIGLMVILLMSGQPAFATGLILHGFYRTFSGEGVIQTFSMQKNLQKNGLYFEYFPNGDVKRIQQYEQDQLIGFAREFGEDGTLLEENRYLDGRLQGTTYRYYENGQMKASLPYWQDRLHGEAQFFYPGGELKQVVVYKLGKVVSVKNFTEQQADQSTSAKQPVNEK